MQVQQPIRMEEPIQREQNKEQDQKVIWRPRPSTLLYHQISINHICNIEDSFYINQKSLRYPQHEQESFLKTIFYFKSVARVSVSEYFVTLHLKKRDQNYLPKQYFIERFKSFGDRHFYEIAVHLEHIAQHLSEIKSFSASSLIKENFSKQKEEEILQQSLQKLEKRKFFCFFYEFTQQGSSLNQIILSKALLRALGYDYQDIALGFLKYQQAIFEIISPKLYYLVMEKKSQLVDSVFSKMKKNLMSPEQVRQYTMFRFNDDLLPKSTGPCQDDCERKIRSRIKFSKTHPSVTIFEIQKMNKKRTICFEPKTIKQKQMIDYKKHVKKQQYECVKNLLKLSQNSLEQNIKKTSSYKLIKPETINNKKRRMKQSSSQSQYLGFD